MVDRFDFGLVSSASAQAHALADLLRRAPQPPLLQETRWAFDKATRQEEKEGEIMRMYACIS